MLISVASGKGGTGKTTVVTNLALALAGDYKVQVLDCDVEEPNLHLFLRPKVYATEEVTLPVPEVDGEKCILCGACSDFCAYNALALAREKIILFPELCNGCRGCTMVCPVGAIQERPHRIGVLHRGKAGEIDFVSGRLDVGKPLAPPVIKAVKEQDQGKGIRLVDAPPGTSCSMIEAVRDTQFCLLVTEPTPFGLHDLKLAVGVARILGIPLGVVVNKSTLGYTQVEDYCREEGIPILLKIPFQRHYAALYARGGALVSEYPEWERAFREVFLKIERLVRENARTASG